MKRNLIMNLQLFGLVGISRPFLEADAGAGSGGTGTGAENGNGEGTEKDSRAGRWRKIF